MKFSFRLCSFSLERGMSNKGRFPALHFAADGVKVYGCWRFYVGILCRLAVGMFWNQSNLYQD